MIERGRRAICASDRDKEEGARPRASRHADQHGQSSIDILESRMMERGRRARGTSDGDKFEGTRLGASKNADQYG